MTKGGEGRKRNIGDLKFILQKYVKDVPYYSEEVPHNIENRPEEYWLADPIDGTSSWSKGFEGYVIQAAYVLKNKPFFSFIYWPEKERFYHCIRLAHYTRFMIFQVQENIELEKGEIFSKLDIKNFWGSSSLRNQKDVIR